MNIKTNPLAANAKAPQKPKAETSKRTTTLPEIDRGVDDLYDKGWSGLDRVADGLMKTPTAVFVGAWSAVPAFGLAPASYVRQDIKSMSGGVSGFTKLANLTSASSNVAGLAAGGLAILSGVTGLGPVEALALTSGALFGLAGLSGLASAYEVQ